MASSDQTRLLIVEDVPQVAQYIRGLLNAQAKVKLLDVLSDGAKALPYIQELRPDVVLVDALLQGRVKGPALVDQIRQAELGVPVIVLTVPQNPMDPDPEHGVHGVLAMPFSGFELINVINDVRKTFEASNAGGATRIISVFAPKGGVGKTTIAFNLAVAIGPARPADRPHRRQPPVRRPAGAAQGPDRRALDHGPPRPTGSPSRTWATSSGATRRASTSCWPRRGSRWPR